MSYGAYRLHGMESLAKTSRRTNKHDGHRNGQIAGEIVMRIKAVETFRCLDEPNDPDFPLHLVDATAGR